MTEVSLNPLGQSTKGEAVCPTCNAKTLVDEILWETGKPMNVRQWSSGCIHFARIRYDATADAVKVGFV